jgi:hypothetical protein
MFTRSRNPLWIIVLLLLVNLSVWYYTYSRPRLEPVTPYDGLDEPAPIAIPQAIAHPPPQHVEPIEVTLMLLGESTAREGAVAIKSVLMHASRPVNLHLICSDDAIPVLEKHFQVIKRPYYPVRVRYYKITREMVEVRSRRAGLGMNFNVLSKLFIQEILRDVEKAIFIDTDMIFVGEVIDASNFSHGVYLYSVDPVQLWDTFSTFSSEAAVSFPTLGRDSHAGRICTCVMLLNLARMRASNQIWMPSSLLPNMYSPAKPAFKKASVDGVVDVITPTQKIPWNPLDPFFADQGVYHVIWTYQPKLFQHLSLRWDITHCREDYGLKLGLVGDEIEMDISEKEHIKQQIYSDDAGEDLVVPGILHLYVYQINTRLNSCLSNTIPATASRTRVIMSGPTRIPTT